MKTGLSFFLTERQYRFYWHIAFLAVYLAYMVYCAVFYRPFIPNIGVSVALWGWFLLFNTGLAYFNIYFLMPKYLYNHKYIKYAACISLLVALMALSLAVSVNILDVLYRSGQYLSSILSLKILLPLTFACPMAVVLYRRWHINEVRIKQLENAAIQTELEQLKKQINPHFLFNMLNNIVVLLKTNRKEASKILLKLNDLLRYQLMESEKNKTRLTDDIQFLNDFLNLEKIRRDSFEFTINVFGNIDDISTPPLLFIPFVENAVKHNPVSEDYTSYVRIEFHISEGNLLFACINSKPAISQKEINLNSGIGLVNIKRRLELLYPKNHYLDLKPSIGSFQVVLQIPLSVNY